MTLEQATIAKNTPAENAPTTADTGLQVGYVGLDHNQDRDAQIEWLIQSLLSEPVLDVTPRRRSFIGSTVIRCDPDDETAEAQVAYRDLAAHFTADAFETIIFQPKSVAFQQNVTYRGEVTGRDTAFKQEASQIIAPGGRVIMVGRTISCMPTGTGFERESVHAFSHPDASETLFVTVERKTGGLSGWEPVEEHTAGEHTEPHECLRCGATEALYPPYTVSCPTCGATPEEACGEPDPDGDGLVAAPYGNVHPARLERFEEKHKQECAGWGATHTHEQHRRVEGIDKSGNPSDSSEQQSLSNF